MPDDQSCRTCRFYRHLGRFEEQDYGVCLNRPCGRWQDGNVFHGIVLAGSCCDKHSAGEADTPRWVGREFEATRKR